MGKTLTIEDLLNSLQNPNTPTLENTKENWDRIYSNDPFDELGLEKSELEEFLKEWKANNDYDDAF